MKSAIGIPNMPTSRHRTWSSGRGIPLDFKSLACAMIRTISASVLITINSDSLFLRIPRYSCSLACCRRVNSVRTSSFRLDSGIADFNCVSFSCMLFNSAVTVAFWRFTDVKMFFFCSDRSRRSSFTFGLLLPDILSSFLYSNNWRL